MKNIVNIETALKIYLSHTVLQVQEVMKLFGVSRTTAGHYLKQVRAEQIKEGIPIFVSNGVDCAFAYSLWGIDFKNLEKKYKTARSLGLTEETPEGVTK